MVEEEKSFKKTVDIVVWIQFAYFCKEDCPGNTTEKTHNIGIYPLMQCKQFDAAKSVSEDFKSVFILE